MTNAEQLVARHIQCSTFLGTVNWLQEDLNYIHVRSPISHDDDKSVKI